MNINCALELQCSNTTSGQCQSTITYPIARVCRRKGALLFLSETPPLKKAIKFKETKTEVYFRYIDRGMMTLISSNCRKNITYQYNLSSAQPNELEGIKQFAIELGAIPKSLVSFSRSCSSNTIRRPLGDITNATQKTYLSPLKKKNKPKSEPNMSNSYSSDKENITKTMKHFSIGQQSVMASIVKGDNIFFTGSAGTGKSYLLKSIPKFLSFQRTKKIGEYVEGLFYTATTGIAAFNINGITLHNFAGIGVEHNSSVAELLEKIKKNKQAVIRWKTIKVLVIDEISMLDAELFENLEYIARKLKGNNIVFGGVQLILCGDFFQLPPVSKDGRSKFCFESEIWKACIKRTFVLDQVFRQKNVEFIKILNDLRKGNLSKESLKKLNGTCAVSNANFNDFVKPIIIFSHNKDVQNVNASELKRLPGKEIEFKAVDRGRFELLKGCPSPALLYLKKGAQVILVKTISQAEGLVNGARGKIVGFTQHGFLPIVDFESGKSHIINREKFQVALGEKQVLALRYQIPLNLAWAISIHKSQGLTFDKAIVDVSKTFEYGQIYVALSRVRSLEGLHMTSNINLSKSKHLAHPKVLEFYGSLL